MTKWLHKVGVSAAVLSLGFGLAGCDSGSGQRLLELFFGIVGGGENCTRVVIEVDLGRAGAVVAENRDGSPRCDVVSELQSICTGTFDLDNANNILSATIENCTFDGNEVLFSCLFSEGLIDNVRDWTTIAAESCDDDPTPCVTTTNGDPCDDPNCQADDACITDTTLLPTTSTSTTTTSSSTTTTTESSTTTSSSTTTTTSSTTSTTLPPCIECNILFHMGEDIDLGALQFVVDYGNAEGNFLGKGENVECSSLVPTLAAFNDKEEENLLKAAFTGIDPNIIDGPADVAECTYRGFVTPLEEDFSIETVDASSPSIGTVSPLPDVTIRQLSCRDICSVTTSTTTSTSSTLEPPTTSSTTTSNTTTTTDTTTTTSGPTTTTTMAGPGTFDVTFTLVDDIPSGLGALQWDVFFDEALGDFDTASCTAADVTGQVFPAYNQIDGSPDKKLAIAYISLGTFGSGGNVDVATCPFTGSVPTAGDFTVNVVDASATPPLGSFPSIVVSSITPTP